MASVDQFIKKTSSSTLSATALMRSMQAGVLNRDSCITSELSGIAKTLSMMPVTMPA